VSGSSPYDQLVNTSVPSRVVNTRKSDPLNSSSTPVPEWERAEAIVEQDDVGWRATTHEPRKLNVERENQIWFPVAQAFMDAYISGCCDDFVIQRPVSLRNPASAGPTEHSSRACSNLLNFGSKGQPGGVGKPT
jgi:hypothetical protein